MQALRIDIRLRLVRNGGACCSQSIDEVLQLVGIGRIDVGARIGKLDGNTKILERCLLASRQFELPADVDYV